MSDPTDRLIASDKLPSVLLIFGEEDFLVEEAYRRVVDKAVRNEQDRFNTDMLSGEETTIEAVVDIARSYPMMSDRRVVVVKNFDKLFSGRTSKKNIDDHPFAKYLAAPPDATFMLLLGAPDSLKGFTASQKKKRGAKKAADQKFPFNILLERYKWIEYGKIYESDFPAWAESRIKSHGKKIRPEAVELLIGQSGQTLRDINNEIEKIIINIGDKSVIDADDVAQVVGASRKFNVFELQNAISARSAEKATLILENMLAHERQEMLIITMLTRYFTALWKLMELAGRETNQYNLARQAGISFYFLAEYQKALRNYRPAELDNAFTALRRADRELKTSSGSNIYIMQKMLLSIIDGETLP
ncbi:MAG: DNA polymerase III subunit delta [Candidatus Kapaibacterium sp.]